MEILLTLAAIVAYCTYRMKDDWDLGMFLIVVFGGMLFFATLFVQLGRMGTHASISQF